MSRYKSIGGLTWKPFGTGINQIDKANDKIFKGYGIKFHSLVLDHPITIFDVIQNI